MAKKTNRGRAKKTGDSAAHAGGVASTQASNGRAELTKQLWQAAVELRGSIEPADYKRYVLPIIFLRFLSVRYERRRVELERLIDDPESEYHRDTKALDEPDEYRAAGAFIVPEAARWENIVRIAQRDDVKIRLDGILDLLEKAYPQQLRGLLPPVYAGSNMDRDNLAALVNLFSKDVFAQDHGGEDMLGRVYEYFIGEFASSEGKRGGEYFTPSSIVRTLVAMLEPERGIVFDPCCGSGGMFVQSARFRHHDRQLSFIGQESKEFTYRLCRMNLFIHGLDGNIALGNSYFDDQHTQLRADYLMANPPFNDGSKGENGWGADKIAAEDPRRVVGGERMVLASRNANTMWIMHFLHHLKDSGMAGFVMGTGELTSIESSRLAVRQALVEGNFVDCLVQLRGQLFANTPSPCSLWILARGRDGRDGGCDRRDQTLFIDARALGSLLPGAGPQYQLLESDIARIASAYRAFRADRSSGIHVGFSAVAGREELRKHEYSLAPARYVGNPEDVPPDESYFQQLDGLRKEISKWTERGATLDQEVAGLLAEPMRARDSWPSFPIGELIEFNIGGGWGLAEADANHLPVSIIRGTDIPKIRRGEYCQVPRRFENAAKLAKRRLVPGDIILEVSGGSPKSGQTTGRSLLVTAHHLAQLGGAVIPASFCKLLRFDRSRVDPYFVAQHLDEMFCSGRVAQYEIQSTGLSNLKFEHFKAAEMVPLPPLPVQHALGEVFAKLLEAAEVDCVRNRLREQIGRIMLRGALSTTTPQSLAPQEAAISGD